jgi:hypothetical protein
MKTNHNGLYIGLDKKLIAFLVGAYLCGLGVVVHIYVSKRGVIRASHSPYNPDFQDFTLRANDLSPLPSKFDPLCSVQAALLGLSI